MKLSDIRKAPPSGGAFLRVQYSYSGASSFMSSLSWWRISSNAVTGLIAGVMHVAATSFASPSLLALPIFVHAERPSNFVLAIACAAISIVLSFVLTWALGFEDPAEDKM